MRIGKRTVGRMAQTPESIKYKNVATKIIREQIIKQKWTMPPEKQMIDVKVDYFFTRKGQDANNYLKIPYDVFTKCGVWSDDQYGKPQTGLVVIDKFNPRLEITISYSDQVGVFNNEIDRESFIRDYSEFMSEKEMKTLLKKLDDYRITEDVDYDKNHKLKYKK